MIRPDWPDDCNNQPIAGIGPTNHGMRTKMDDGSSIGIIIVILIKKKFIFNNFIEIYEYNLI